MNTQDQIANSQHRTSSPKPAGATILLVDDEEMITRLHERQLKKWGYQTVACNTIAAALSIIDSDQPIDLVVTDYIMPQMKGTEFAGFIQTKRPQTPVVICTGIDLPFEKIDLDGLEIVALIRKPMQAASFLDVIRTALSNKKP